MLPYTTTLGWATWDRARKFFDSKMTGYVNLKSDKILQNKFNLNGGYPYYNLLLKQISGDVHSWGIAWYLSVFMKSGLVLYPRQSLVAHDFDGSGTHCRVPQAREQLLSTFKIENFPPALLDEVSMRIASTYFWNDRQLWSKGSRYLSYLYKKYFGSILIYTK